MIRLLADIKAMYTAPGISLAADSRGIKMDVHRDFIYPRIKNYLK
jgi:hypothetical protein